ncbi:zinc finger protein 205 [Drosophila gunungcola]|uniref:Uncharacterized protein n=1 Tax=Drosophila gunungcola TaxID=103775 RepID=A0A9P9YQ12_9MUSC|nr:zinc finger protein 205 [Drosophila gunungcola]KAI8041065.1 hypothetical protein M5D96_005316 [Drosophila gunungcola]
MLDISQMCRVCRDESDCLVDLFAASCASSSWDQEQQPHLATMLAECSGCSVARTDGMPQFVCVECAEATRNAFRLRRQCQKSRNYFDQLRVMIQELDSIEAGLKVEEENAKQKSSMAEAPEPQPLEPLFVELVELKYKLGTFREKPSAKGAPPPSTPPDSSSLMQPVNKRARSCSGTESWSPGSDQNHDEDEPWRASRKRKGKKVRRAFQCRQCDQSFAHNTHLSIHMRTHTGERPFKCPLCPRSFAQKGNLGAHTRCHTGERPFMCPFPGCRSRFRQIGQLNVHSRVHTGEKPYKCNICRSCFIQKVNLQKHMIVHTGVKYEPSNQKIKQNLV